MKCRFIRAYLVPEFEVAGCCRVLGVSHSSYYRWRNEPIRRREADRTALVEEIRTVHEKSRRVFGSPRVHHPLIRRGRNVRRNTVAKTMRSE